MRHVPVLCNEVIEALCLKPGARVVDATLGDAGHSEKILEIIGPTGKLLGIDVDPESLLRAKQYLYRFGNQVTFVRDNFAHLKKIIDAQKFYPVDAILLDLGWSSPQFIERGRGFSFTLDEPLDMRFSGPREGGGSTENAADILATSDWDDLYRIFRLYGEEDLSREITDAIVATRIDKSIATTGELVSLINAVYRKKLGSEQDVPWVGGLHPATKVFQALRIAVNKEFEVLRAVLPQAMEALTAGGRLAVITFHSGEDRIVKHFFKSIEGKTVTLITKKPIEAGEVEYQRNPSARSAKLRVAQKI